MAAAAVAAALSTQLLAVDRHSERRLQSLAVCEFVCNKLKQRLAGDEDTHADRLRQQNLYYVAEVYDDDDDDRARKYAEIHQHTTRDGRESTFHYPPDDEANPTHHLS